MILFREQRKTVGLQAGRLAPCPSSPNCVSSDASEHRHRVQAYQLSVDPGHAWQALRQVVADLARTRVIEESVDYLHAECRSMLWGFIDDLEFHLRPSSAEIAVRSASRLGYSDLGVNRRRVQRIRRILSTQNIVKP